MSVDHGAIRVEIRRTIRLVVIRHVPEWIKVNITAELDVRPTYVPLSVHRWYGRRM
jgi:hypothetical protein